MVYQLFRESAAVLGLGAVNGVKSIYGVYCPLAIVKRVVQHKAVHEKSMRTSLPNCRRRRVSFVGWAPRAHQAWRVHKALVGRGLPTLQIAAVGAALPRPRQVAKRLVAAEPLPQAVGPVAA
jgi:hypothetical protein